MLFMSYIILSLTFAGLCSSVSDDLYNTKTATSDLQWTAYPDYGGWEELTTMDLDGRTIRSYQVCNHEVEDTSSWVRTPYIPSQGAKRAYIDVEFSMVECNELSKNCKETFNLYFFEYERDVASSTFPPWRENPYIKIDTIAAGERFSTSYSNRREGVNFKTWTLGPLSKNGFYIAAHDQGACMSILSLKVYYFFCPHTVKALATFPRSVSGNEVTSLDKVSGQCIVHSNFSTTSHSTKGPTYYCNSNGEWKVPTGDCSCNPGYEANSDLTECKECDTGKFKSSQGNHKCSTCPLHSVSASSDYKGSSRSHRDSNRGSDSCVCKAEYYRTPQEDELSPCSQIPSSPRLLKFDVNTSTVVLLWKPPIHRGGRLDLFYKVTCMVCTALENGDNAPSSVCKPCQRKIKFEPRNRNHFLQNNLTVTNLQPFTTYQFQVYAMNGVSNVSKKAPASKSAIVVTNEAAPSAVLGVQLISSGFTNLSIKWNKPSRANGVIRKYQLFVIDITQTDKTAEALSESPFLYETNETEANVEDLKAGHLYSVKVRSTTAAGFGPYSAPVAMRTLTMGPADLYSGRAASTNILIASAVSTMLILLSIIASYFCCRKRRILLPGRLSEDSTIDEKEALNNGGLVVSLPPLSNDHQTYIDYPNPHQAILNSSYELNPAFLKIEGSIGQGEFGEVCRGKLKSEYGNFVSVAVKRMKGESEKDKYSFYREASTMAQFSHQNVLQLKGVVTKSKPPLIVMELMENGSLDMYLQKNRGQLSVIQLLEILKGIACGMKYLSSMNYVHRDLAARNILLNNELVCKVSDFGLSRTLENNPHATYTTQGGKIAIRWTAPECIRFRKFTLASDVWSYGIVMWETMSYGEKPYWDMTNQEVMESIDEGYRLPAPFECPVSLHRLMVECWAFDANQRPKMERVCSRLNNLSSHPTSLLKVNLQVSTAPTTPCIDDAKPITQAV